MASNLRTQLLRMQTFSRYITRRKLSQTSVTFNVPEAEPARKPMTVPQPDGEPKVYSEKLEQIFRSISQLNLLEVAELSSLLKTRLNLPDPVMSFGAMAAPAGAAASAPEEPEAQASVQTSFTVKLLSFDDKQKVALIKELKNLMSDLNLVQAKKIIESAPTELMKDIGKDEADKIKEALSKVGGNVEIV